MNKKQLKEFLDRKVFLYNQKGFIENDPISIPHMFSQQQDKEIMGLFAAILAWGQRAAIIKKCKQIIGYFDNAPYDFIRNHQPHDLKRIVNFKHRTFNDTDLLSLIQFLQGYYQQHSSLETAFSSHLQPTDITVENALRGFYTLVATSENFAERTTKHLSSPARRSACKRLCMYLRWMVRKDKQGVDFGIWQQIKPSQLICPLDVHVERQARKLGLLYHPKTNWIAALELTENLRGFDAEDPVKYDFALFGMGIEEKSIL